MDNRQDVFQDNNDDGDRQTDISLSMKGSSVVRGRKRSHVYKRDERGPCTVGGIYSPPRAIPLSPNFNVEQACQDHCRIDTN